MNHSRLAAALHLALVCALALGLLPAHHPLYSQTADQPTNQIANQIADRPAAMVAISFDGAAFTPASLSVAVGTQLVWVNNSAADHTLQAFFESRIYLPAIYGRAAVQAESAPQTTQAIDGEHAVEDAPQSPAANEPIFKEVFRAGQQVSFTVTNVGQLAYALESLPGVGGVTA
jgi:plastocyanin